MTNESYVYSTSVHSEQAQGILIIIIIEHPSLSYMQACVEPKSERYEDCFSSWKRYKFPVATVLHACAPHHNHSVSEYYNIIPIGTIFLYFFYRTHEWLYAFWMRYTHQMHLYFIYPSSHVRANSRSSSFVTYATIVYARIHGTRFNMLLLLYSLKVLYIWLHFVQHVNFNRISKRVRRNFIVL